MEVATVGASGVYSNTSAQATRPQAAQEQQQVERREQQRVEQKQAQPAEQEARPVVNAQGQTTGTLINVKA